MCLSKRFCLLCLLVYLWVPQVAPRVTPTQEDKHIHYDTEKQPITATHGHTDTAGMDSVTRGTTVYSIDNEDDVSEHDHDDHQLYEIKPGYYMSKLLSTYGNGINITFEGFEHLLKSLGLGRIVIDHSEDCHKQQNSSNFVSFHTNHNHSTAGVGKNITCVHGTRANDSSGVQTHTGDETHTGGEKHERSVDTKNQHSSDDHAEHDHEPSHEHSHEHDHSSNEHDHSGHDHSSHDHEHTAENSVKKGGDKKLSKECIPKEVMLHLAGGSYSMDLTPNMFMEICPSLVYQVATDTCDTHNHDHVHDDHQLSSDHDHQHDETESYIGFSDIPLKVWGFSSIAVLIISLVGLLGVAVIPIMQKVFYNHMLQFLVAMAVGALSGDALLHLLPHAIQGGHGSGEGHHEEGSHDTAPIYKGLCGLMGIYFFFLVERVLTIVTQQKRQKRKSKGQKGQTGDAVGQKLAANDKECGEMMMSIHPNKALKSYAEQAHDEHCEISLDHTTSVSHQHGHSHSHAHHSPAPTDDTVDAEENETMLSQSSDGHGHGHSHCRSDGVPDSIAAIAWMVILGDGIHNFSDGLAIGAAFASSITGGFSTSIAVFCHELPHEIGDFAMLLRAGMKAKQAIIYNCLSSVLCFIGMLIGVAIGNLENASLWIFAVVGGMFLYIALVDMLPEMTSVETKKGENPFTHLFLQCSGMMLGAGIMLVIALYEEKLKTVLD